MAIFSEQRVSLWALNYPLFASRYALTWCNIYLLAGIVAPMQNFASNKKFWIGVASTLAGGILWGVSGACAQYIMSTYGVSSLFLTSVRTVIALLLFLAVLLVKSRYLIDQAIHASTKTKLAFLAFGLALFLDQYAYALCIEYTNAGTSTVLAMLGTVFCMLFTCILVRRLPRLSQFLGLILAFVATVLIATQGNLGVLSLPPLGLFWGIFNALAVAAYAMIPRHTGLFSQFGSLMVTAAGTLISCICANVLFACFAGAGIESYASFAALDAFGWLLLMGGVAAVGTFLSFALYLKGVSVVGAVTGTLLGAIEPVSASACAAVFLGTAFTGWDWLGLVLMLGMLVLVTVGGTDAGSVD